MKIINFINTHIKYPELARKNGTEGVAVIRFVVDTDGSLLFSDDIDKTILRNPGDGCGAEALRVVKMMPKWIPGKQNGKVVKVQFTMPIKFKLAEGEKANVTWGKTLIQSTVVKEDGQKIIKGRISMVTLNTLLHERKAGLALSVEDKDGKRTEYEHYYFTKFGAYLDRLDKDGKQSYYEYSYEVKGGKLIKKKAPKIKYKVGEIIKFVNYETDKDESGARTHFIELEIMAHK